MKLLEMKHINKEFEGIPVLRDVSLSVAKGEDVYKRQECMFR